MFNVRISELAMLHWFTISLMVSFCATGVSVRDVFIAVYLGRHPPAIIATSSIKIIDFFILFFFVIQQFSGCKFIKNFRNSPICLYRLSIREANILTQIVTYCLLIDIISLRPILYLPQKNYFINLHYKTKNILHLY